MYTTINLIIVAILSFILGIAFSFLLSAVSRAGGFREKFGSPSTGDFELDWTVKEVLAMFSESAGSRWYEARALVRTGIFFSILCAVGLLYVVRFDFEFGDASGISKKRYYHGLRPFNSLKKAIGSDVPKVQKEVTDESYFLGALVTGYNYIYEF